MENASKCSHITNKTLTFEDKIEIFSYRTPINGLNYNTKGPEQRSRILSVWQWDRNDHLLLCNVLNEYQDTNHKYDHLLNGTLAQQKYMINIEVYD